MDEYLNAVRGIAASKEGISSPWEANNYRYVIADLIDKGGVFALNDNRLLRNTDDRVANIRTVVHRIRHAAVVLWRRDLSVAAAKGKELFKQQPFHMSLVRFEPQLWVFELDWRIGDNGLIPSWYVMGAVLIFREDNMAIALELMMPKLTEIPRDVMSATTREQFDHLRPRICGSVAQEGQILGTNDSQTTIVSHLHFMNLEITAVEPVQHSRQVRRAAERDNRPLPDLRVITLRRQHVERKNGDSANVEWSCQWLVGGHWRNQWYPSTEEHRPVYIVPYVKGPENKPFRENHAEKIFVVAR